MNRRLRKAISTWSLWRFYRRNPELRARADAIKQVRRAHGGIHQSEANLRRAVNEQLRAKSYASRQ